MGYVPWYILAPGCVISASADLETCKALIMVPLLYLAKGGMLPHSPGIAFTI